MSPSPREHPVFSAHVSSFTRREKPAVETRNLSWKNRMLSQAIYVTRISINWKSLEMTRNNLVVNDWSVNYFLYFLVLNEEKETRKQERKANRILTLHGENDKKIEL